MKGGLLRYKLAVVLDMKGRESTAERQTSTEVGKKSRRDLRETQEA